VLTALPRLPFPCGFHSATCLAILQSSIRMTWLRRLNCCSSVSCNVSPFPFLFWFQSYSFVTSLLNALITPFLQLA
jgi:hypothetical protein